MKWDGALIKLVLLDIACVAGVVVNAREEGVIDWRFVGLTAALLALTGTSIVWRVRRGE